MRGIKLKFITALKIGSLKDLLEKVKTDKNLCLEIRKNYINIYYKGGNLLQVTEKLNIYQFHFDYKYCNNKDNNISLDFIKSLDKKDPIVWINNLPLLMSEMDSWFLIHPKAEREVQHNLKIANSGIDSDVIIIDIEYAGWTTDKKLFRLDMLGIQKLEYGYKLILFENKYGGGSIGGSAGIKKHYDDIVSILNNEPSKEELISSVINIINNKADLGFFEIRLKRSDLQSIEILFLFTEYNLKSMAIKNALAHIEKTIPAKLLFMGKDETVIPYSKAKDLWEYEN